MWDEYGYLELTITSDSIDAKEVGNWEQLAINCSMVNVDLDQVPVHHLNLYSNGMLNFCDLSLGVSLSTLRMLK